MPASSWDTVSIVARFALTSEAFGCDVPPPELTTIATTTTATATAAATPSWIRRRRRLAAVSLACSPASRSARAWAFCSVLLAMAADRSHADMGGHAGPVSGYRKARDRLCNPLVHVAGVCRPGPRDR